MTENERTRAAIIEHCHAYPKIKIEDIFKFLHQSSFGCEHMVSDENRAIEYIKAEHERSLGARHDLIESLDGKYSRVHLGILDKGLSAATLGRLFCLSAKREEDGAKKLSDKLSVLSDMVKEGLLPFGADELVSAVSKWENSGFSALHHSDTFREEYSPAYRVIANEFVPFLQLFARIDTAIGQGRVALAIEGGSASGKSTLAQALEKIYDCTVFHMDDFFLRPEQRTPERFAQPGGNVDRERFLDEVALPLTSGQAVSYRRFDCSTFTLGEVVTVIPKLLTVVEGAYSMHPELADTYNLSVFLDISPELQKKRIEKRNSPMMAKRFFEEWIPLEKKYFDAFSVKDRCDMRIEIN